MTTQRGQGVCQSTLNRRASDGYTFDIGMLNLSALAAFYAALDEEELESVSMDALTAPDLNERTTSAVATDEEESAVATSAVENAEADDVAAGSSGSSEPPAELSEEGEPRRATHDGTMLRDRECSSPLRRSPPLERQPHSEPGARRRTVTWAPGIESPKPMREILHKRARLLSEAQVRAEANFGQARTSEEVSSGHSGKRRRKAADPNLGLAERTQVPRVVLKMRPLPR